MVDGLGQLGVALGTEDGTGAGVGVEKSDFLGGQREVAVLLSEVGHVVGKEDKIHGPGGSPTCRGHGQEAELVTTMNAREYSLGVFEVIQADKRTIVHQVLEEKLGRIVGGDTGRDNAAHTPGRIPQYTVEPLRPAGLFVFRFLVAGAYGGEALGDSMGGDDEKVAAAARRIIYFEGQNGLLGVALSCRLVHDKVEGGVEEAIDEAGGCVVRAGGLSLVTGATFKSNVAASALRSGCISSSDS